MIYGSGTIYITYKYGSRRHKNVQSLRIRISNTDVNYAMKMSMGTQPHLYDYTRGGWARAVNFVRLRLLCYRTLKILNREK
jgi:hypothetical protein